MIGQFIPEFHFVPAADKLTPEWCKKAIDYYWYNSNIKSLLWDKNIQQIHEYATGDIKMGRYKAMYKSFKKKEEDRRRNDPHNILVNSELELDDLIFQPHPIIQNKVNAGSALIEKIPIEISCTANDALAMKKKKEDIQFLKNKPKLESQLNDIADQMGIEQVDLGTTKHSYDKYGDNPFGLDLSDPQDQKTFIELIYALRVEVAMEKILTQFKDIKNVSQIKQLETRDQYWYAISCNKAFRSSITGLPDAEWVWPGDVYTIPSVLPDYSDVPAEFEECRMTVMEMFNFLSPEICDLETLSLIINGAGGWCLSNSFTRIDERNFNSAKVNLLYCEVKSVDSVGVYSNPKSKRGYSTLTYEPTKCTDKIWGQNTYCFWWLKNTKYYFMIDKLDYAHRAKGKESYQNFSKNIYKSNLKSAVELSIGENIKAQIAEIKLNYAVAMAKADGVYIDIRGLRNAVAGLKNSSQDYTEAKLLEYAMERNIFIADTAGFEGKNDGQFKPIIPIEGGLKNIVGYLEIQDAADKKINQFIGTNDSLTGISSNPDALIGVEKLRIDASINALYYITKAIECQQQKLYNIWGNSVQYSIKEGGAIKDAMINFIGSDDVELIAGLNEVPIHDLTLKVTLTQREQEKATYQNRLNYLIAQGAITLAQEYMLSVITNPKQRFAELARIESKYKKEQDKIRQEQYQNAQAIQDQKNQGVIGKENAAAEGVIKNTYAKGDVEAKVAQLLSELGIRKDQFGFVMKRALQQDRGQDQYRKAIATVQQKQDSKLLEPLSVTQ